MKKLVLSALVAGALAMPAVAQNYQAWPNASLGTATGSGTNSWPFSFGSTTGRFQEFLDGSLLPSGTPLKIVNIAFSASSGTAFSCTGDFQLRMSNTPTLGSPSQTFGSNQPACPTNLISSNSGYTYTPGGTAQWADLNPACHFGWDGKSNICVEIRYRGKTSSIRNYSDTSIPRAWSNVTSIDNYNAATGNFATATLGLVCRLEYVKDHVCLADAQTKLGGGSAITLHGFTPGESYQIAASLGQSPFSLGNCNICLNVDSVFWTSVLVGGSVFGGYAGIADASGNGAGKFVPPAIPALAGTCVYHAAVGISRAGISCTNTAGTELIP